MFSGHNSLKHLAIALLIFLTGFIGLVNTASAQTWVGNGPYGGAVEVLAVDPTTPTTIYAGTQTAGIFKSTNGGGSWIAINNGLIGFITISALAIDPSTPTTIYAATVRGLFKSTDGGGSWTSVSPPGFQIGGTPNYLSVDALVIDPATPTTLYVGSFSPGGVFKSNDSGASWTAINSGLPGAAGPQVTALVINPLTPTTLYAVANLSDGTISASVFKSTDAGGTWNPVSNGLPAATVVEALAIDPVTPTTLYASVVPDTGGGDGVYKSTDGGASWNAINNGLTALDTWSVAVDPATPTTIYAGDVLGGRVFKSTNGGGNWSQATTPNGGWINAFAFAEGPTIPATIFAAGREEGGGVFKSTDGGTSWTAVDVGLSATHITALAVDATTPTTIYAGTGDGSGGLFKSMDRGTSWTAANSGLINTPPVFFAATSLVIDPTTPSTLYVAGNGAFGGLEGVYKSTNGGGSWTAANTGLSGQFVYGLAIDPTTPTTIYVGTVYTGTGNLPVYNVYKSTDGGGTWNGSITGLPITAGIVNVLAINPVNPTTLYAGTANSGVFMSTNGGESWTSVNNGLPAASNISALVIDPVTPTTLYAVGSGYYFSELFKSTNGGANWTTLNTGFDGTYVPLYPLHVFSLAINPVTPTTLYAVASLTTTTNVLQSTDGGANWGAISGDLFSVGYLAIDSKGSNLYVGTYGGVFSTIAGQTLTPTTTTLVSSENPSVSDQNVTLTATVASGSGTPQGAVAFFEDANEIGAAQLNAGVASLTISPIIGSHTITAAYAPGIMGFAGSTLSPALVQVVNLTPTTTSVFSSSSPSAVGQSVTFTARVSPTPAGNGIPTGTVTFIDGTVSLGTSTLSVVNSTLEATFTTSSLAIGSHSITASYSGDSNFLSSTSLSVTQTVGNTTSTGIASSLNPSVVGQSVTFTATVTGSGGTPTGTVTFFDGTASLGMITLAAGKATLSTSALAIGSHSITVQYGGDSNFGGSTSSPALMQVVNGKASGTALISSLNPEVAGESVTFTAAVTSTAGGTPTGTVTFYNGATSLGTSSLNGSGVATFSTTALAVGSPSITASYSGDANFASSASSALTETVSTAGFAPAPTGLTVAAGNSLPISLTLYAAAGSGLNFSLSCLGAPSKTTCQFSSNPVAPGPPLTGTTVQLTFGTSSSGLPVGPSHRDPWPWGAFGLTAALATLFAAGMNQLRHAPRRRLAFSMCLAVIVLGCALIGCGGGGTGSNSTPEYTGTPKGSATFTVMGVSGTTTISIPVTVTVQ